MWPQFSGYNDNNMSTITIYIEVNTAWIILQ